MKIYLDNGATTKVDPKVVKAMQPYFTEKYGNPSSLHFKGQEAKMALEESRAIIAKKLNAHPDEIIFTSGGSESNNLAIKGLAYQKEKGHIITTKFEHKSVLNTCKYLEKKGFKVTYLNVDKDGFISLKELEDSITPETIIVSIVHANNEIGTIQDINAIGEICKKHNIAFHIDAVQSFTKVPISVKKANLTFVSLSSHKIHGPKGIGALFIKKGTKIEKLIDGGSHEFDLRAGTENIPGIVGFALASKLVKSSHIKQMTKLRDKLINGIFKIKYVKLNGPKEKRLCNNVNVSFKYIEGEALGAYLDGKGICTSTGSACTSKTLEPSHVLTAIGVPAELSHGSMRLTLSKFTTEQEIDYTLEMLSKYVKKLRKISPFDKK